jgi:prevent-host-death family protein
MAVDGTSKNFYVDLHRQPATFMYMTAVGVAELRQNLSKYLRLVDKGERLVVTDRNRPVAELGPPPTTGQALDRLIAEGCVSPPRRRGLPAPLKLDGDPHALSRALDEVRGER